MPACRFPDGEVVGDSFVVMERLLRDVNAQPPRAGDQRRLEKLFLTYVLARGAPGRRLRFIHGWAKKRDQPTTIASAARRGLLCLYFLVLIVGGGWSYRRRGRRLLDLEALDRELGHWADRLSESDFIGGARPNAVDYALCGQLQCMASGLTDETLPIIAKNPPLMRWLERMHRRLEGYTRLHTKRLWGQNAPVRPSARRHICAFYVAIIAATLAAPVTLPAALHALSLRGRSGNSTGALLSSRDTEARPDEIRAP